MYVGLSPLPCPSRAAHLLNPFDASLWRTLFTLAAHFSQQFSKYSSLTTSTIPEVHEHHSRLLVTRVWNYHWHIQKNVSGAEDSLKVDGLQLNSFPRTKKRSLFSAVAVVYCDVVSSRCSP